MSAIIFILYLTLFGTVCSESCQCDKVMKTMMWRNFLPSYLKCESKLICILKDLGWMDSKENLTPFGVIETFKNASPVW